MVETGAVERGGGACRCAFIAYPRSRYSNGIFTVCYEVPPCSFSHNAELLRRSLCYILVPRYWFAARVHRLPHVSARHKGARAHAGRHSCSTSSSPRHSSRHTQHHSSSICPKQCVPHIDVCNVWRPMITFSTFKQLNSTSWGAGCYGSTCPSRP